MCGMWLHPAENSLSLALKYRVNKPIALASETSHLELFGYILCVVFSPHEKRNKKTQPLKIG